MACPMKAATLTAPGLSKTGNEREEQVGSTSFIHSSSKKGWPALGMGRARSREDFLHPIRRRRKQDGGKSTRSRTALPSADAPHHQARQRMLEYLALLLLCEICLPRICIFWPYFLAAYRAHQMNDISVGKNNDLMRARWRRRREPDRNSVAADPHSTSVRLDTPPLVSALDVHFHTANRKIILCLR